MTSPAPSPGGVHVGARLLWACCGSQWLLGSTEAPVLPGAAPMDMAFLGCIGRTLPDSKATVWTAEAGKGVLGRKIALSRETVRGLAQRASRTGAILVPTPQSGCFPLKEQGSCEGNLFFFLRCSDFYTSKGPRAVSFQRLFLDHRNTSNTEAAFCYHCCDCHQRGPSTGCSDSLNFILFRRSSCMGTHFIS